MGRLVALILVAVFAAAGIIVADVAVRDTGTVSTSADGVTPRGNENLCPNCV